MTVVDLEDQNELCHTCGEFVGDGHMTGCPDWRLGQTVSWKQAVLVVLHASPGPCSIDDLLSEIRLRQLRSFRQGSSCARTACRRAVTDLCGGGEVMRHAATGLFFPS